MHTSPVGSMKLSCFGIYFCAYVCAIWGMFVRVCEGKRQADREDSNKDRKIDIQKIRHTIREQMDENRNQFLPSRPTRDKIHFLQSQQHV